MITVVSLLGCGGDDGAEGEGGTVAESGTSNADGSSSAASASAGSTSDASTSDASTSEASTSGADEGTGTTGDTPEIPAACEAFGLPAEWGQETVAGHFTTVANFEATGLESWLGELPAADAGVLVLATHDVYDCDHILADSEVDTSYGYSRQIVYVFPGAIAIGEYTIGTDVRAYSTDWLGDGGGNGGGSSGEITEGTLSIVNVSEACVTGTQAVSDGPPYGFALSTDAVCG